MVPSKEIILGIIIVCNSFFLFSQAGILDSSFNGNGLVVTGTSNGVHDNGRAVLVQDDGKIVLAGITEGRIGLIRYNEDGSLDDSFGSNGIVLTTYGNDNIWGVGAAIQNDHKILVGGQVSTSSSSKFSVARYNQDGTLDLSFGNDGIAIADGTGDDHGRTFCLQADGKLLVGGYSVFIDIFTFEFSVLRFNSDGSVDASFGTDGLAHINNLGHHNELFSIAMQADGNIVAAGQTYDPSYDQVEFAILRFNNDGTPDSSFNSTGTVYSNFNSDSKDCAYAIAIQADYKIVIGGNSMSNSDEDFALARYNPDGSPDPTFGQNGTVVTDLGSYWDNGYALNIQPDGKIILAGIADSPTDVDYVLVRYNADGSIDDSFGDNGVVWTDFGIGDDKARAICLDLEGRIIAAGYSGDLPSGDYDFSLARYLNDLSIGIVDFNNDNLLTLVYPNPVKNNTRFEYELKENEIISLSLYDMNGQVIQSFIKDSYRAKGKHSEQLNINEAISSGSYILVLDNGKNMVSVKVFKH